jgi:hypothetical protein
MELGRIEEARELFVTTRATALNLVEPVSEVRSLVYQVALKRQKLKETRRKHRIKIIGKDHFGDDVLAITYLTSNMTSSLVLITIWRASITRKSYQLSLLVISWYASELPMLDCTNLSKSRATFNIRAPSAISSPRFVSPGRPEPLNRFSWYAMIDPQSSAGCSIQCFPRGAGDYCCA